MHQHSIQFRTSVHSDSTLPHGRKIVLRTVAMLLLAISHFV